MKTIQQFMRRPWLYLFIVLISVSLKFYRLDYKLFWYDEICVIAHTSGGKIFYSPVNEIKNISFYTDQLHLKNLETTIDSQLRGLFSHANLSLMHYPLLMIWYRIVGDDLIHYRLFSVFIFLITLPFLFLLAKTMFKSNLAGWIIISIYSISPFFHQFAQEARYYILWAFFIIVFHFLFLKAIQHQKLKWFIIYSVIGIMAMYTSLLSGFVIFGHLLYIWILNKNLRLKYCIVLVAIFLFYSPWIHSIIINKIEIKYSLDWHKLNYDLPLWGPLIGQLLGFVRAFVFYKDYTLFWENIFEKYSFLFLEFAFDFLILTFIIIAFIFLVKKSKKENAYFLILMIAPGFLFFYISDIARNGWTSIWWRYHIFNIICVILVITNILNKKIEQGKLFYSTIYIGLVIIGLVSILTISNRRYWYLGGDWQQVFIEDARLFSNSTQPLVVTDFKPWMGLNWAMVVFGDCDSDSIDILRGSAIDDNLKERIPMENYSDIYVFQATDELVENLKLQFGERMDSLEIKGISPMWKINNK